MIKLIIPIVCMLLFLTGCQAPILASEPEPGWGITMLDNAGMVLARASFTPVIEPQNLPAPTAENIRNAEAALKKSIDLMSTEFLRGETVIITLYLNPVTHKIYVADLYQETQKILGYIVR